MSVSTRGTSRSRLNSGDAWRRDACWWILAVSCDILQSVDVVHSAYGQIATSRHEPSFSEVAAAPYSTRFTRTCAAIVVCDVQMSPRARHSRKVATIIAVSHTKLSILVQVNALSLRHVVRRGGGSGHRQAQFPSIQRRRWERTTYTAPFTVQSLPRIISIMHADDVTSCPPAAARFSKQGKALDTAQCEGLRDTPTVVELQKGSRSRRGRLESTNIRLSPQLLVGFCAKSVKKMKQPYCCLLYTSDAADE